MDISKTQYNNSLQVPWHLFNLSFFFSRSSHTMRIENEYTGVLLFSSSPIFLLFWSTNLLVNLLVQMANVRDLCQGRSTSNVLGVPVGRFMCSTVRGASCRRRMECGKGNGFVWVPPLLYTSINNSLRYCVSWWIRCTKFSVLFVGVPLKEVGRKMCLFIGFQREKMLDNDG